MRGARDEAIKTRSDMLRRLNRKKDVDDEVSALLTYLEDKKVKKHILKMIEDYKKTE